MFVDACLPLLNYTVYSTKFETEANSGYSRPPPLYEGHVPLSTTERVLLAFGSAFMSLYNPWRGGWLLFF